MAIGVSGLSDAKRPNGKASDHAYHTFTAFNHHRDELLYFEVFVFEQAFDYGRIIATDPCMSISAHEVNPGFVLVRGDRRIPADGLALVPALDGIGT